MNKTDKIALLSVLSSCLRIASGPITLIIISYSLSNEELGFYYAFFGVVGMKMLFEAGMSNVIKVTYSHIKIDDVVRFSNLYKFSKIWYLIISVLLFIFLYTTGNIYFYDYSGSIEWRLPWLLLILTTSILIYLSYIEAYLDGRQKQIELKIIQIANSFSVISLWLALYFDLGLYSIAIMQATNITIYVSICLLSRRKLFNFRYDMSGFNFFSEFKGIWRLLRNVVLVWFVGYFFWNGFNLLSFKLYSPEIAGVIGLSLALAKTGYTIAGSVLTNQMTLIAFEISNGNKALDVFYKYLTLSSILLFLGYSTFFLVRYIIPDFYVFDKVLSNESIVYLFLFFMVVHIFVSLNNYVRAYKIEPFVLLSTFNALSTIISFYLSKQFNLSYFQLPLLSVTLTLVVSVIIFIKHIK